MGLFSGFMELMDENSPNSFENTLNKMIEGVESTIGSTLETAEQGIKKIDDTVTTVQTGADSFVKKADVAMTKIDGGQERVKASLKSIDGFIKPSGN